MRESVGLIVRFIAFTCTFAATLTAQVSVLTHHGDNARTGANLNETILNISNVNPKTFGKLATRYVEGNIYAQPLVAAGAQAIGRTEPTNLVIVATQRNHVYAFDGDDVDPSSTKALLWKMGPDILGPAVATETLNEDIARGVCVDITPEIGITSTPVVQFTKQETPREGVVYVVAKSKTETGYHYTLFALRLSDGSKISSVELSGEIKGSGLGSVGGKIRFNPMLELNRPGLLLVKNRLYVAFGGHCDHGDYHGWLFAYDVSNPRSIKQTGILNTTPNGLKPGEPKPQAGEAGAGIWMSGEGVSIDDAGFLYFTTGNGTNNHSTDFGDSVVKVRHEGKNLKVVDWFAPENEAVLNDLDIDLGSTGAMLLPDSHLLITGGKDGHMYLLDRNNLGKASSVPVASFQVTHASMAPVASYGIHGTPAAWLRGDEMFVYTAGAEDPVRQYRLVRDPEGAGWKFDPPSQFKRGSVTSPFPSGPKGQFGWVDRVPVWMPGGFMTLSAKGDDPDTGILWVTMPVQGNANHMIVRGMLRALDASDVSKPELWNSEATGDEDDRVGAFAKFVPPTVVNGKVYVATFDRDASGDEAVTTGTSHITPQDNRASLVIFGLR